MKKQTLLKRDGNKSILFGGEIGEVKSRILVIDCELLFDIKKKWFSKDELELSDFNRKFLIHLNDIKNNYDEIIIGCVRKHSFVKIALRTLRLDNYSVEYLSDEDNYKIWLNMINPECHLALVHRRYYHRNSNYFTFEVKNA